MSVHLVSGSEPRHAVQPRRAVQSVAIAAVGVPCALLAHLLATGAPPRATAAMLVTLAVLAVAAAVPARDATGLAAITALTQLAAQTVLAVLPANPGQGDPACIPAVGRAASLGLRLAVLSADGGCPSGSLALGAAVSAAFTALLVAVAIVAGNAAVALLTGLLLGRALTAGTLLACLSGALHQVLQATAMLLRRPLPLPRPQGPALPCHDLPRPPVSIWCPGVPARRGPPGALVPAH